MRILVTGANGFVGRNLCSELKNIRDGKASFRGIGSADSGLSVTIDEVFQFDLGSSAEDLDKACSQADFVFNLAGVNRPVDADDYMRGNCGFAQTLLDTLRKHGNTCPVMLAGKSYSN